MSVASKLMTADELLSIPDDGRHRRELVRGALITMSPSGARRGRVAARILRHLGNHVAEHQRGETFAADAGFLIARDPDTVRVPDGSFVIRERMVDVSTFFPGAPDLAVEVISPTDRYSEVEEKVREWIAAGTRMVILIDPERRTGQVRTPDTTLFLGAEDVLSGGDVVPGWALPLRPLFE